MANDPRPRRQRRPRLDARARSAGRAVRSRLRPTGSAECDPQDGAGTVVQPEPPSPWSFSAVGGIVVSDASGRHASRRPTHRPRNQVPSTPSTGEADTASGVATSQATTGERHLIRRPTTRRRSTAPADTTPAEPAVDYVSAGFYAGPEWVGNRTTAITDTLADGLYRSDEYSPDGNTVTFRLAQRIRGDASVEEFGDSADTACCRASREHHRAAAAITMTADGVRHVGHLERPPRCRFRFRSLPRAARRVHSARQPESRPSAGVPDGYCVGAVRSFVVVSGGRVIAAHQQFGS